MKQRQIYWIFGIFFFLLLAACTPNANPYEIPPPDSPEPAGFFMGLWHGMIVIITFIISLFTDSVGIYEVNNNGTWYHLGYIIGLSIALGGGGHGSGRWRRRRRMRD